MERERGGGAKSARNEIYSGSNLIVFAYRLNKADGKEAPIVACVSDNDRPVRHQVSSHLCCESFLDVGRLAK